MDDSSQININVVSIPFNKKKGKKKEIPVSNKTQNIKPTKLLKPLGILKKTENTKSSSIWKKIKEDNKTSKSGNEFKLSFDNKASTQKVQKNVSFVKIDKLGKSNDIQNSVDDEINQSNKQNFTKFKNKDNSTIKKHKFNTETVKISSLFGNNPEIPSIPHRAIKPIKEAVFSDLDFSNMDLHPFMVKNMKDTMGMSKATTVQQKSIPVLLKGDDALIRSQTGSGKTLAYALPLLNSLQSVRPKINRTDGILALVIVPTRELALQTYEVFDKLVKSYTWIVPGCLVGGEKRKSEKARLRKGVSILVGTPGRLLDHLNNTKALRLNKVEWLVLDEADRLLELGYEKDVASLIAAVKDVEEKQQRQTVLLSATLTPGVEKLAGLTLSKPVYVDASDESSGGVTSSVPVFTASEDDVDAAVLPEGLVQKYIVTPAKLRLVTLAAFILWKCKMSNHRKMLIFIATQDMVDYHTELLAAALSLQNADGSDDEDEDNGNQFRSSGIELFKLQGGMDQKERTQVFKTFREARSGVLLCTDVASRGLDLPQVDWVVQYTGPTSVADYVHRAGRTARAGERGSSVIFLTPSEVPLITKLETRRIRLQEEKMETCLDGLLSQDMTARSMEEAATRLQIVFENIVAGQPKMKMLASRAFASWVRFYSCYPKKMRDAFSVKKIHMGHYAKSFALTTSPTEAIKEARNSKRTGDFRSGQKRVRNPSTPRNKLLEHSSKFSAMSEFESGLEPSKKKQKMSV